jgi:hypothetical protein
MDPLLAWDRWTVSVRPDEGGSPASQAYPWSVRRFLTATRKGCLDDYTEVDLREFLLREAATAYERHHYERAVRSFFGWCRHVAGAGPPRLDSLAMPNRGGARSRPLLQSLMRLAVVVTLAILVEVSLATTLVRLTR